MGTSAAEGKLRLRRWKYRPRHLNILVALCFYNGLGVSVTGAGGNGQQEILDVLRALVKACGHESAGANRCAFQTAGCTCGQTERLRVAYGNATRLLREEETFREIVRETFRDFRDE